MKKVRDAAPSRCADEVARTESNRLPGQEDWTTTSEAPRKPVFPPNVLVREDTGRERRVVMVDVSRMSPEQAEGAVLAVKGLY
jgi:hypothetical protein